VWGSAAGGRRTAAMVATGWPKLWPKVPSDLVPVGYAISGVFDLRPLTKTSMNQDFRLDEAEAERISPILWTMPPGRVLDAAVGDLESSEFKRQSRAMVDAWGKAKVETRYAELPGNHFPVIDALADPKNTMVARIAELAEGISA